jgi:hypothetical protein
MPPSASSRRADAPLNQRLATTISKASLSAKDWREIVESPEDRGFSRFSVSKAPERCEGVRRLLWNASSGDSPCLLARQLETQSSCLDDLQW